MKNYAQGMNPRKKNDRHDQSSSQWNCIAFDITHHIPLLWLRLHGIGYVQNRLGSDSLWYGSGGPKAGVSNGAFAHESFDAGSGN